MSCPYCCGRRKVRLYALEPMSAMRPVDVMTQTIEPDIRDKEFPCPACSTIPKDAVKIFATQTAESKYITDSLRKEDRENYEKYKLSEMVRAIGDHLSKEKDFYEVKTFADNPEVTRVTLKVVRNSFDTEELEQDRIDEVLNAIGHAAINHVMRFNNRSLGDSWKFIYNYELRDFISAMLKDAEFKETLKHFIKENRIIDYK